MIVAYASVLEPLIKKYINEKQPTMRRLSDVFIAIGAFVLFVAMVVINRQHDKKLKENFYIRSFISQSIGTDSYLIGNIHVVKMLHPAWTGKHAWELFDTQELTNVKRQIVVRLYK